MRWPVSLIMVIAILAISAANARADWTVESSIDETTGEATSWAKSPIASTTRKLGSPFEDLRSQLRVGCNSTTGEYWMYLWFSKTPNLRVSRAKDGYSLINLQTRIDDRRYWSGFQHTWGEDRLHNRAPMVMVPRLLGATSVLVEVPWYTLGEVDFLIDLDGMADAMSESFKACGTPAPQLQALTSKTRWEVILDNDEAIAFEQSLQRTRESRRQRG